MLSRILRKLDSSSQLESCERANEAEAERMEREALHASREHLQEQLLFCQAMLQDAHQRCEHSKNERLCVQESLSKNLLFYLMSLRRCCDLS